MKLAITMLIVATFLLLGDNFYIWKKMEKLKERIENLEKKMNK